MVKRMCSVDGCTRPSKAKGMCSVCYGRVRRNTLSPRFCVTCGDQVYGPGATKYCSSKCALIPRSCQWCGRVDLVEVKRRSRPFCSQTCAKAQSAEARKRRVMTQCQWCGVPMERRPSEIRKGRGKFCSRTCAGMGRPIDGRPSKIADDAIATWLETSGKLCITEHRVGRWSIDLAFPLRMLAVELDGEYWHSLPEMIQKDARKDAHLQRSGWTVERIVIHKDATASSLAAEIAAAVSRSETHGSTSHRSRSGLPPTSDAA